MKPCPICDLDDGELTKVEAFAVGVALGVCFSEDMHRVTELCCEKHRAPYVTAMACAAVITNTVPGE